MAQIIIIDFGSQTTHLIGRRLADLGVITEIIDPHNALKKIKKDKTAGIILSGGPSSVYGKGAPKINKEIFKLGIPILGICYGWQLTAYMLGGKVNPGKKEYGPAELAIKHFHDLFHSLPDHTRVFESHGDSVFKLPAGFKVTASTNGLKFAAVEHSQKNIYGVQFHPEMHHTQKGNLILKNFATKICNLGLKPKKIKIDSIINQIRENVGSNRVIGAFSGGTDSAVAGVLAARAIGKQFIPIYIESGLMRTDTIKRIKQEFPKILGIKVKIIHAEREFMDKLKGISDPEQKRKIIGRLYINLFERQMKKYKKVKYLLQGTTYADFIHSQGTKRSARIKSHHNVGGLPPKIKMELLEPLRYYYTDQVRQIGLKLGLPKEVVFQQPFPGPGHAVRIMGAINSERLKKQIQADQIVVEVLKKAGWYNKVFQCFSIMTGANSTAVKGDSRFYGEVVAVRIINSRDRMTADWSRIPNIILEKISAKIINQVPGISRVVYDITSKPPATMEWE